MVARWGFGQQVKFPFTTPAAHACDARGCTSMMCSCSLLDCGGPGAPHEEAEAEEQEAVCRFEGAYVDIDGGLLVGADVDGADVRVTVASRVVPQLVSVLKALSVVNLVTAHVIQWLQQNIA